MRNIMRKKELIDKKFGKGYTQLLLVIYPHVNHLPLFVPKNYPKILKTYRIYG